MPPVFLQVLPLFLTRRHPILHFSCPNRENNNFSKEPWFLPLGKRHLEANIWVLDVPVGMGVSFSPGPHPQTELIICMDTNPHTAGFRTCQLESFLCSKPSFDFSFHSPHTTAYKTLLDFHFLSDLISFYFISL